MHGPPAGRSREGLGHRHDLHLRRHSPTSSGGASCSSPARSVIGRDGRIRSPSHRRMRSADRRARRLRASSPARPSKQAQTRIVELLARVGRPRSASPSPITHPVKFYEKGDRPLEIVTSRQWYIRNGGRDPTLRDDAARARARSCDWHRRLHARPLRELGRGPQRRLAHQPPALLRRAVPALVPRSTTTATLDYDAPDRPADEPPADRPVDGRARRATTSRSAASPAASSATPTSWTPGPPRRSRRRSPAAGTTTPTCSTGRSRWTCARRRHEIIRTWLFSTVAAGPPRARHAAVADAAISGWVLDPDRKKMSKSKGNVVTPMPMLEQYGADAVRYWAASGAPGTDTAFDEGQMKVGRRLAIKMLNASRFVLGLGDVGHADVWRAVTEPLDRRMLAAAGRPGRRRHRGLRGLRLRPGPRAHRDVLLVVLRRLPRAGQGPGLRRRARGGRLGPGRARSSRCRRCCALFAPFLPFVTEEVWSWWQDGSVHRSPGRTPTSCAAGRRRRRPRGPGGRRGGAGEHPPSQVRRQASPCGPTSHAVAVSDRPERLAAMAAASGDIRAAGRVAELTTSDGDQLRVDVVLAE